MYIYFLQFPSAFINSRLKESSVRDILFVTFIQERRQEREREKERYAKKKKKKRCQCPGWLFGGGKMCAPLSVFDFFISIYRSPPDVYICVCFEGQITFFPGSLRVGRKKAICCLFLVKTQKLQVEKY
jgi:hypothetical protein